MKHEPNPVLIEITRGSGVESLHRGALAIAGPGGETLAAWGDTEALVFPRSAMKSVQAVPLLESGAADALGLGTEELALACASHSGGEAVMDRVRAWLRRIGRTPADLVCGAENPFGRKTAYALRAKGIEPDRTHHNCSGKHTGYLSLAAHLGAPVEGYDRPGHPVQDLVGAAISASTGFDLPETPAGFDGCGVPAPALPLSALARAMARLAHADPGEALGRLRIACLAHPELVAGPGRACTVFMMAGGGRVFAKTGAEGVYAAALPERGLGIALKIDDGATRAAEALTAELLVALDGIAQNAPGLERFYRAEIRNTVGASVGAVRPSPWTEAALADLLAS